MLLFGKAAWINRDKEHKNCELIHTYTEKKEKKLLAPITRNQGKNAIDIILATMAGRRKISQAKERES